jgi:hypothetical protein
MCNHAHLSDYAMMASSGDGLMIMTSSSGPAFDQFNPSSTTYYQWAICELRTFIAHFDFLECEQSEHVQLGASNFSNCTGDERDE